MPEQFTPAPIQTPLQEANGRIARAWSQYHGQFDAVDPGVLLGRDASLAQGPLNWVTLGAGLSMTGSVLSATPATDWSPYFNVRAYGAVGDGATDDTAAIQSAIAAAHTAGGGTVAFPSPAVAYQLTAIQVPTGVSLLGMGRGSILRSDISSGTVITCQGGDGLLANFLLELTNAGSVVGIGLEEARGITVVERVFINAVASAANTATGIKAYRTPSVGVYAGSIRVSQCYLTGMKTGVDFADLVTSSAILACTFTGWQTGGAPATAGSKAINIDETCSGNYISGNVLQGWASGLYSRGGYLHYAGNYHETNTAHVDWAKGASNARVWGLAIGNWYLGAGTVGISVTQADQMMSLDISSDTNLPNVIATGVALIIGDTPSAHHVSSMRVYGLPTSSAGLNTGEVWVDTTGGLNILKIV